jgi:membrane protein implicated in regulation of membrane protease activity
MNWNLMNWNLMNWIWLCAIVVFSVLEAVTTSLVSIWFVCGSAVALIAAVAGASIPMQTLLFVIVSAVILAITRPIAKKITRGLAVTRTNADRVLGQEARVTEEICNDVPSGAVYVDGKTWTARSADGGVIPVNALVRVERMEGVKLIVERVKEKEAVQ